MSDNFQPSRKRRALEAVPNQSLSCFWVAPPAKKAGARPRTKFEPGRRKEVAEVRKRGACLRCRWLKRKCDGNDPCGACLELAAKAATSHQRRILQFSDCIRTFIATVSTFEHALPPLDIRAKVWAKEKYLKPACVADFYNDDNVPYDNLVSWMSGPRNVTVSSLSSNVLLRTTEPVTGSRRTAEDFQRIIYAAPFSSTSNLTEQEYQYIIAISGHNWLCFLDKKLASQSLSSCSVHEISTLFYFIMGTMAAVSQEKAASPFAVFPLETSEPEKQPHTLFDAMQSHLCRTLAHYLLILGNHLGLRVSKHTERLAIDAQPRDWQFVLSPEVMQGSNFKSTFKVLEVDGHGGLKDGEFKELETYLREVPVSECRSDTHVTGNLAHLLENLDLLREERVREGRGGGKRDELGDGERAKEWLRGPRPVDPVKAMIREEGDRYRLPGGSRAEQQQQHHPPPHYLPSSASPIHPEAGGEYPSRQRDPPPPAFPSLANPVHDIPRLDAAQPAAWHIPVRHIPVRQLWQ